MSLLEIGESDLVLLVATNWLWHLSLGLRHWLSWWWHVHELSLGFWHTSSHVWWHWHVTHLVWLWLLVVLWTSWVVVVLRSSTALSSHHVSILVEVVAHLLVLLHDVQKLLEDLGHVWLIGPIILVELTSFLLLVLLEVGLIDGIVDLDISELFDLVVVDHERLTLIVVVVEGSLGMSSLIWLLEANESKTSVLTLFELDVFDFSELLEDVLELLLWPRVREVLDVEVASLLGGLVSESLLLLLGISLGLLHGVSDVKFHIVTHVFSIKGFDSFLGALWSILLVKTLWIIIADETVFTDIVAHENAGFDGTIGLEELLDLGVLEVEWDVLDIDVVDQLSEGSSILGLELDGGHFWIVSGLLDSLNSRLLILEADETISS